MNKISKRFKKKRTEQIKRASIHSMHLVDFWSLLQGIKEHKVSVRLRKKYGKVYRWDLAKPIMASWVSVPCYTPCGKDLRYSSMFRSLEQAVDSGCPPNFFKMFEDR